MSRVVLLAASAITSACATGVTDVPSEFLAGASDGSIGTDGWAASAADATGGPTEAGNDSADADASGGAAADGGAAANGAFGDAVAPVTSSAAATDAPAADATPCASESIQGKVFPVDIFVMMDQSASMLDTVAGPNGTAALKWDLLKQAFMTFVNDPGSAGIGFGIQYFPIPNAPGSSCDAGTYAVPYDPSAPPSGLGVPIALLPGNAPAIANSLNAHTPGGSTPTVPALTGALEYATGWAAQNPTHRVVVVLATDGVPHGGCPNNTVVAAAAVAQGAAAGTPPIPTYVIGIGSSLASLDQIAQGGGTAPALVVSPGQDVAAQFLGAMDKIRSETLVPCALTLPSAEGGAVDFNKVNVVDTPDGGAAVDLLQVPGPGGCDPTTGGWFYDNPAAPGSIHLCPATCDSVTRNVTDEVDIVLGCVTRTAPPPPR